MKHDERTHGIDMPAVGIDVLEHGRDLPLPQVATAGSSGYDLRAAVTSAVVLEPGRVTAIATGLRFEIPPGFEAQVRPRSGLAARCVGVLNSPGTIDADYRGELQVILVNLSERPFRLRRGDRIAQLVIAPVSAAAVVEVETLERTARGAGGFGSTGR